MSAAEDWAIIAARGVVESSTEFDWEDVHPLTQEPLLRALEDLYWWLEARSTEIEGEWTPEQLALLPGMIIE